ncbi:MAG: Membrane bound YbgT-like protein [Pseudomonadota bacterium]|jgi:cyd operon protein YbgT
MWYFTWILGLGLAIAAGIISVVYLEGNQTNSDVD